MVYMLFLYYDFKGQTENLECWRSSMGEMVAEWLSSWLAEQENRGSIPGLATWIFRYWLSPAAKSRYMYGWKIAKSSKQPSNKPPKPYDQATPPPPETKKQNKLPPPNQKQLKKHKVVQQLNYLITQRSAIGIKCKTVVIN